MLSDNKNNSYSNSRLLELLDLNDNVDPKIIKTKVESLKKEIAAKELEIQTIQKTIQAINKLEAGYRADISNIYQTILPNSKKEIEKLNSLISQKKTDIQNMENDQNLEAHKNMLTSAIENKNKLIKNLGKKNAEKDQLKEIDNLVPKLEKMIIASIDAITARKNELAKHEASLKNYKTDLKKLPQHCDLLKKQKIPDLQETNSQQTQMLSTANLQLESLKLRLLRFNIMIKKLSLDEQSISDATFVKETNDYKETLIQKLLNSTAPLNLLISIFSESYRLENETYFQDFSSLLEEIKNTTNELPTDDKFKEAMLNVLTDSEKELTAHRNFIKSIAKELRLLADQTAKRISEEIKSALEKLITAFKKQIQPYVNSLKISDGKRNNLIWHSKLTLQAVFTWTNNLIFNHAIKVADFFNETNAKFDLVKMEKDNLALVPLKPNLDLEEILKATLKLQNEHEFSQEELKKSHEESKLTLIKQERRTAIKTQYTIVLDKYEKYRNEKYKIKDFFYNKDKIARHDFIEEIKIALWKYESLDCNGIDFNTLIQNGISKFKNGFFSNKKDPTKNLQDILIFLNRDTQGVPPGQDTSLRISEFIKTAETKERKTTILEKYSAALDQFEFFVKKYHNVKDTFFGKDKVKRQMYMKKLKTTLKDYEASTAPTETVVQVVKTVKEGLDTFKDYPISGKHDPMKNLQRILYLLLQDILNPLEHTYLRISGYLDKEHAPIPLDSDLPPTIALR